MSRDIGRAFVAPRPIIVSLLLALPLAGFACGVLICSDCGGNPLNYLLMGLVHAAISTIGMGSCRASAGGGVSLWPYLPLVALGIWLAIGSIRVACDRAQRRAR